MNKKEILEIIDRHKPVDNSKELCCVNCPLYYIEFDLAKRSCSKKMKQICFMFDEKIKKRIDIDFASLNPCRKANIFLKQIFFEYEKKKVLANE